VNNLHTITLYKLQNKLSCEWRLSCSSCRASRSRRVERVELVVSSVSSRVVWQAPHSQKAWAWHVERAESCRDVTNQVEFGLITTSRDKSNNVFDMWLLSVFRRTPYSLPIAVVSSRVTVTCTSTRHDLFSLSRSYGICASLITLWRQFYFQLHCFLSIENVLLF